MRFLLPLLAASALLPTAAQACVLPAAQRPLLHERLPRLSAGAIAAEVEIVTDLRSAPRRPLEARIIRMLRGNWRGTRLRIEPVVHTSCDGVPYRGMRGVVVGHIRPGPPGILVIDPIRAPSELALQRQRSGR